MLRFSYLIRAAVATLCASATLAHAVPAIDDDGLLERLQRAKAELQAVQAELDAKLASARAARAQPASDAPGVAAATEPAALADNAPADTPVVKVSGRTFDPLRLKVVMHFPPNVRTIQQATQYLLETANYKLALSPTNPEETRQILSRPLLPQDRDGSLKAIEDALLQISGDDTVLIIDREHKMLSFEFHKP